MKNIIHIENFLENHLELMNELVDSVCWDDRMLSRKTASFGKPYNYSQIEYTEISFPDNLYNIKNSISKVVGFEPNNCLVNYYLDGKSKMGFHSDQIDMLCDATGIVIISLGDTRVFRFRNINNKEIFKDYILKPGSLFYMSSEIQNEWHHSILKGNSERISLTFRQLK
jgi:alkylated DNA repair dioxygenase AlkB